MRRISSFFLALILVLVLSAPALAAEVGVVEYKKGAFSFGPGTLHYPTDLFPALKDVMPGDVLHQQIQIRHRGSRSSNLRLYIKAGGSDENADFIRKLHLEVEHKSGHILYDGPDYDATDPSGWIRLATLAPGKSATLDLTLTVPKELGNDYAENLGTVIWKFKAEEIPVSPDGPKTGDAIGPWIAVLTLSGASLILLMIRKKHKIQY